MTAIQTDRLIPDGSKHSKFWQNAHLYFDRVYQTMNLDPVWHSVLSTPKRVLTVSCPVRMDDGTIQVFTGYRRSTTTPAVRSKAAFATTPPSIWTR